MNDDKIKNHPLEELLEIEAGSTPTVNPFMSEEIEELELDTEEDDVDTSLEEVLEDAPIIEEFYDPIDKKNEQKFQSIYDAAMDAFGQQAQEASMVEGRFRARNLEVAAQFLRIGLDSAKDSAHQKANKDKLKVAQKKANNSSTATQNNFFLGDRNDLLKKLAEVEQKDPKVINDSSDPSN